MHTYKPLLMIMMFGSCFFSTACTHHKSVVDEVEQGLTVSQIYHQSMQDNSAWATPHYRLNSPRPDYVGYTRDATNETQMLFKPLDNPSIPMFVYPHVALVGDEQILKPGFTTAFFLYKQNQYALANEQY